MSSADSLRRLRRALENLPKELDDTYDQAMNRIQCQKRSKTDLANKVLSWVIFARRPVTIEELRCALAVEPGDSDLDEEGLPDSGYLLSVCGGLVMISGDTETVRFIHYTVQEYFERARHPQSSSAHTYLATTCITYLSFSTFATLLFEHEYEDPPNTPVQLLGDHVLLQYASKHWGNHVRECCDQNPAIHAMVRSFLTRKANVSCSLAAGYCEHSFVIFEPFSSSNVTDLHVAATFGLHWLVEELLQQGASVDARGPAGRTPLHEAAAGGYTNVVRSLLERGANPEFKDQHGQDAMALAATAGHEPATRLLLQEASLTDMELVIRDVATVGHLGVLRLILESLKDTTKVEKATYVGTALHYASWFEHEACIRLLLEEVEDLEMSELQSHLDNALRLFLERHNFVITKLLLDHGADPTKGLHRVAEHCDIAGVRHVLDRGANIEAVSSEGDRPVHLSLRSLSSPDKLERMLQLLLKKGADIDAYGSDKKTPLMTAAKLGYADLVQCLLHNGADVLARDGKFNRSAIEWGVLGGCLNVVQLLLRYQRTVETSEGLLALTRLYQVLRFGASKDVDSNDTEHEEDSDNVNSESEIDDESSHDRDPEPRFYEEYNRLLSDINTLQPEDLERLLLLHQAVRIGDEILVHAFIDMRADIEALDDDGRTPLLVAVWVARIDMVSLLLELGADPTSVEDDTMPSFDADYEGFETAMQLIKDAKQRWVEGAQSRSPSPSIIRPGTKRRISRISD